MQSEIVQSKIVTFLREKDYKSVKTLGQGACGKTVLLFDDQIQQHFVCKKFTPFQEDQRKELFSNFIREIKLLYLVQHKNIVRIYNCYLYPSELTGYILMEYVEGSDIEDFLAKRPELINEIFTQTIDGFQHLEANKILHRDIRPQNMMVGDDGILKIIDLGFGKRAESSEDFDKSISLNLWCDPPKEFSSSTYNFCTEVYFVGKLFEGIIQSNNIEEFQYKEVLREMCQHNPEIRTQSFSDVDKIVQADRFDEIHFSYEEKCSYRAFADALEERIAKIRNDTKYHNDIDEIQMNLEDKYRSFMLEEFVPDSTTVLRCFINGAYYFQSGGLSVQTVSDFISLLKSSSREKRSSILSNLHTRLDAIPRYSDTDIAAENATDDDLPF